MKITDSVAPAEKLVQVAALPLRFDPDGIVRVLLLTSRETRRWIIPKGWPMKGRARHEAAATEAREEAGLVGRASKKPLGTYSYFKRRSAHFDVCRVDVFLLKVERELKRWKEKGQRQMAWVTLDEAIALVDEPGLAALLRSLDLEAKRERRSGKKNEKGRHVEERASR
jgi:8-oxo-dGTP pyrophosphatase MutT (NUDIX family)